jgi:hypothetical protein
VVASCDIGLEDKNPRAACPNGETVFLIKFGIKGNNFLQHHCECIDVMEREVCSL